MSSEMTGKASVAYDLYCAMGPTRSLSTLAEQMGHPPGYLGQLKRWSARYGWQRLAAEHDHAALREGLGQREIVKERALQMLVDWLPEAAQTLYDIMTDSDRLPILDRHGEQALDPDGQPMYKPAVAVSTRLEAAKALMGIGGMVPVRRTEHVDRTEESLDAAANVVRSLSPAQVDGLIKILDSEVKPDGT